ncbi:hypothetical protein FQZ97_1108080 [compost metagenome]
MAGPCSAYHSQRRAHFSISPRDWLIGMPISLVVIRAMVSALARRASAMRSSAALRASTLNWLQAWKPRCAEARLASRAAASW